MITRLWGSGSGMGNNVFIIIDEWKRIGVELERIQNDPIVTVITVGGFKGIVIKSAC